MIALSLILIAMAASQVRLVVVETSSGFMGYISHIVLSFFIDPEKLSDLKPVDRANLLGSLISAFGAIVTAVFAVVAWMLSRADSNKRARNVPITNLPVYDPDGVDDVCVMFDEYSHAKSIVVFGGDFSWLRQINDANHPVTKMRNLVERYARDDKIKLISYSNDRLVKKSVGDTFYNVIKGSIIFNSALKGLRASFVESPYGRVLIYKVHADRNEMHICRVTDRTKDGKELLDQFNLLINTIRG